jgi:Spy/CpxP family protein refolding chaperone
MKSFLSKLVIAGCVLSILTALVAVQDSVGQEKKKKQKADPTANIKKKLDSAELPADVLEKAKKIVEEHAPKIAEAQDKVNAILTPEQRQARQAAQKAAKDAGKKGKEAAAEVDAATKLTDEQKGKMEEAQKALTAAQADLNKALGEILTDEQKAKVGIKGKKKKNA